MRKLYWIIGILAFLVVARFLASDVYRWEANTRNRANKDWVLLRENKQARLLRPWEWFNTPTTGLHYLMAVRSLGEDELVLKYKIFNYTDPVTDTEEDHERYGTPVIHYVLVDLANKREYFLQGESALQWGRDAVRRKAREHEGFKIGDERCEKIRTAVAEFNRIHN